MERDVYGQREAHVCRIPRPEPEHLDAAARLRRDIALAVAAQPLQPRLRRLSTRAASKLEIALRDAAGSPTAEIWTDAFDTLSALVEAAEASRPDVPAVTRLRRFVNENADASIRGAR